MYFGLFLYSTTSKNTCISNIFSKYITNHPTWKHRIILTIIHHIMKTDVEYSQWKNNSQIPTIKENQEATTTNVVFSDGFFFDHSFFVTNTHTFETKNDLVKFFFCYQATTLLFTRKYIYASRKSLQTKPNKNTYTHIYNYVHY